MFLVLLLVEISCAEERQHTIVVKNGLPDGQEMTVHCKSKDWDIGSRVLKQDQIYWFRFTPVPGESPDYSCSFQWPGNTKFFNIYKEGIIRSDKHRCEWFCSWTVFPKTLCVVSNSAPSYTGCLPWK